MPAQRPWQVLVLSAHWPGESRAALSQAGAAASALATAITNTRLLYPHGSLPGKDSGQDPFALLEAGPDFGLVGLPSPGFSARTRRIGFAFNAYLYSSALSGPQILLVSDRVVWSWLWWFLRRRGKQLVLELPAAGAPDQSWLRAAAQADAVVATGEDQFEALIAAGIEAGRIFLAPDRAAMALQLIGPSGTRDSQFP